MDIYEELISVLDHLAEAKIEYALCGGLAVALYGYPRFTKDIDLLVLREDVERIERALADQGFLFRAGRVPFDVGKPNEREIYRISKIEEGETLTLDLLVVNRLMEDVWRERVLFDWHGRKISVVSLEGLAIMKRIAGRDQDLLDLKKLGMDSDE